MAFTYFFRDTDTLDAAVKIVTPEIMGRSKIRIWDAGCAYGPEPYTLAILFAEMMGRFIFQNLTIDATDIDESQDFGTVISKGEYPKEQVERIPEDLLKKYFNVSDQKKVYVVSEKLRDRVKFQRHDLLSLKPPYDGYTMIVCKNVLLHFTYEQRIEVLKMYHKALMPSGVLVLEQTQKMPAELDGFFTQIKSNSQIFRKI